VSASNVGGLQAAGAAAKPTGVAANGDCGDGTTTGPSSPGLLRKLGGGDYTQVRSHVVAPTPPVLKGTTTPVGLSKGAQVATNSDVVVADASSLGGPAGLVFCSADTQYHPKLLTDQMVTFSPTLSSSPAKAPTVANPSGTPASVKFTGLSITAPVASGSPLAIDGSLDPTAICLSGDAVPGPCTVPYTHVNSVVSYAYDSTHFNVACTALSGVTCTVGGGFIVVSDSNPHLIAVGKPIVSAPVTLVVTRASSVGMPSSFDLAFGGSNLAVSVNGSPYVPAQVAPPYPVVQALYNSFVTVAPGACDAHTGPASAHCYPYAALSASLGLPALTAGGATAYSLDGNYGSTVATASTTLF